MNKTFMKAAGVTLAAALMSGSAALATEAPAVDIDWNVRYHYEEMEQQLKDLVAAHPELTEMYEIGTTWQERSMWGVEITNEEIPAEEKTGIGVFGPIHGGEREAASCGMYFAYWMLENADSEEVQDILNNYIIYFCPSLNPDGYEQSWVANTRPNLRPMDSDGDGVVFSDPYTDIDGDGYIANVYSGTADMEPTSPYALPEGMKNFGMESCDWNKDGLLGNDPRTSGIDMNRTFRYQFGRYDIETVESDNPIGGGFYNPILDAETEPEVIAIEKFIMDHEMAASVVLHTGEQSVLYPWCYRGYDEANPADAEIPFMADTAAKMVDAIKAATGRDFYSMASHDDYPTAGELIDWEFGRLNIHAYTIEVYCGGDGEYSWGDTLPEATWKFYTQDELTQMGLDPAALTNSNGDKLAEDEGLWFYTSARNQMVDKCVERQDEMCVGIKDAIVEMIKSEPTGEGFKRPAWL